MRLAVAVSLFFTGLPCVAAPAISFSRDIHPILSDKCFACHGPDDKARMAGLRLDTAEGAMSKVKPGDAAGSRLYVRISHPKKPLRMPPPASGLTLSDHEIELIRQWIDEGANWQTHWAYTPPRRPAEPAVTDSGWPRNPIDRFVLARLDGEKLKPSPEADKATLLRRVTFDLTGLPPTPAEIDSFLKDRSPDAWDKVVDRLLASPRYGERMAMPWLDLARYADTHGYHIDSHRDMWPWRDWVIKAFNRNLPYDRFVVEQLAGDLLPNATLDQKIATGFHRNHMINYEGGAIPEEYLNEYLVDRVDTTATVFMGMTMGCARCHDHKYDPIKQREFYRMYAFFNSVSEKGLDGMGGNAEPFLRLPTPEQKPYREALDAALEARQKILSDGYVDSLVAAWEKNAALPDEPKAGLLAHVRESRPYDGLTEKVLTEAPLPKEFSVSMRIRSGSLAATPLVRYGGEWSIVADESLPLGDLQRGSHLYFTIGGKTVRTKARVFGNRDSHVVFAWDGATLRAWLDGEPHELLPAEAPAVDAPAALKGFAITRGFKGTLEDVRLYGRILQPEEIGKIFAVEPARTVLAVAAEKRSKDQKALLRNYYLSFHAPENERRLYAELKDVRERLKELDKQIPTVMVMDSAEKPRVTHVLGRGDYRNLGEEVQPGTPAVLPPMPSDLPRNRLGLAQWLVDPKHPLTARVAVNRFWAMYFGTGLVKTAEDFGSQGEQPSHPELLDWLATEFIRSGWDVKAMQRLIVTSATYRQSSRSTPELNEKDPENRLLARGPRFRLPAEMIRDAALAASGLLQEHIGGPSVFPYSPKNLWEDIAYGDRFSAQVYPEVTPGGLYRRSLYTFWKRTAPPATLGTFDAPDREKCTARRPLTNTPLQALTLLNDPTFVEASRFLAERMLLHGGASDADRIRYGFRLVTGRVPETREAAALGTLLRAERGNYAKQPKAAVSLTSVGLMPADKRLRRDEIAAFTTVAGTILNLDEAITKE